MTWWGWLIVVWLVLVVPGAWFLGRAAATSRAREREQRQRWYEEG